MRAASVKSTLNSSELRAPHSINYSRVVAKHPCTYRFRVAASTHTDALTQIDCVINIIAALVNTRRQDDLLQQCNACVGCDHLPRHNSHVIDAAVATHCKHSHIDRSRAKLDTQPSTLIKCQCCFTQRIPVALQQRCIVAKFRREAEHWS